MRSTTSINRAARLGFVSSLVFLLCLLSCPKHSHAADNFSWPANTGRAYLTDNSSNLWDAAVCMTTDGNSNVIPIGSGGGSVTVSPNTNGSLSNNSVGTAAVSVAAPANAVGFILEAESGNTANCRWAVGATASSSVGNLTEPGRDSGYVPVAHAVSIFCLSAAQQVSVQWVIK